VVRFNLTQIFPSGDRKALPLYLEFESSIYGYALESKPRLSTRCYRSVSKKQMFVDFAEWPKTPWFERPSNWFRCWHSTRRARGVHATTTIGDQHMRMSFVTMTNWA